MTSGCDCQTIDVCSGRTRLLFISLSSADTTIRVLARYESCGLKHGHTVCAVHVSVSECQVLLSSPNTNSLLHAQLSKQDVISKMSLSIQTILTEDMSADYLEMFINMSYIA